MVRLFTSALLAAILPIPALAQQEHQHGAAEKLGTVVFTTSCATAVAPAFNRAMALLHSFEFSEAIDGFTKVGATDPGCAMAYWGIAVSRWGNPFAAGLKSQAQLAAGRAAIEKAKTIGARTDRERDFIAAAEQLFAGFETRDQRSRQVAYRDAMSAVAAKYPSDPEASAFYALSLAAANDPADRTYDGLLKAGAILEKLAAAQPDHPGYVHYLIHAYDVPPLAARAVAAARSYAKIAPSAPHALHMPSHTFTRLGYWQDSIDTNIASAAAARRAQAPAEELHAMDYETYAYLQQAQDAGAKTLVDALPEVRSRFAATGFAGGSAAPPLAGVFALSAIPARYTLERSAWAEAARLEPASTSFANADAITWFAKGIGAARTGDIATARAAVDMLVQLRDKLRGAGELYWTEQVDIQRLGVAAWLALAEGKADEALRIMGEAADREDKTEKNAVTPGPIAPAREQLGYMLLQAKRPADALAAFETTLKKEPNRFLALAGAATAAAQANQQAASRSYAEQVLKLAATASGPPREQVATARSLLAGTARP
jgi:hypothetical protein